MTYEVYCYDDCAAVRELDTLAEIAIFKPGDVNRDEILATLFCAAPQMKDALKTAITSIAVRSLITDYGWELVTRALKSAMNKAEEL